MLSFIKTFFSFAVLITPLIVIHELGHYWAARVFGVKVESFSIGFGTTLWKYIDRHGTQWKISIFPLGGYVKLLDGRHSRSHNIETIAPYMQNQSLHHKGSIEKIIIALAGPFVNYLFSFVVLSLIFSFVGLPVYDTSLGKTTPTSLAYKVGLRESDKILTVNNQSVSLFSDVEHALGSACPNAQLSLQWHTPSGTTKTAQIPSANHQQSWKTQLGLMPRSMPAYYQKIHWQEGLAKALAKINPQNMLKSVKIEKFQGPLGIAQSASHVITAGWIHVCLFMCALSIGLGFFNLLPLPILDGGVALLALFEGLARRKISPYTHQIIHVISLVIIGIFFISISWQDMSHLAIGKKIALWFH